MITVGIATATPKARVMPRFAFSGGDGDQRAGVRRHQAVHHRQAGQRGNGDRISDRPERRATRKITGISSTRPISKNIGSPMSAPTSAIVHGSVRVLDGR